MYRHRRFMALWLAAAVLLAAFPAYGAVFHDRVRVLLSTGAVRSLSFTPVGEFTLKEDPGVKVGTEELTARAVGGRVAITFGQKTVTGPSLTLLSGGYGDTGDYIRLKNSEHGTCTYLGNMTFDVQEGRLRAINTLPIEQYLYGVVPHEMSASFPAEALKAQAVCARSYAVDHCSRYMGRSYDVRDTSKDQVYAGYASKKVRAISAVNATAGQVLTYKGDIIEAFYSSSNGGQTERAGNVWDGDLPYYVNADDPYDLKNASSIEERSFIPQTYDENTLPLMDPAVLLAVKRAAYAAAGRSVEPVSTVSVVPKGSSFDPPSRCYTQAEITLTVRPSEGAGPADEGQVTVTLDLEGLGFGSYENTLGRMGAKKRRLRMYGAERGVFKYLTREYPGWYLTSRRYGHGVGMSQRSAQERARAGQDYKDIIAFYYVGTDLSTVGGYGSAPRLRAEGFRVRPWGVSGINPGVSAAGLLRRLKSEGALSVVDRRGAGKSDTLVTGDFVRTVYGGSTFFDLPIVIFGDLDGDGRISGQDAEALQAHLLRIQPLSGPYFKAADVNHDGDVDLEDMLRLIQYTLNDAEISQED